MTDEAKVLEEVIRDTEQISLKEEEEEPKGEGEPEEVVEEKGSGQGVEPGSAAALLEEFIGRQVVKKSSPVYALLILFSPSPFSLLLPPFSLPSSSLSSLFSPPSPHPVIPSSSSSLLLGCQVS